MDKYTPNHGLELLAFNTRTIYDEHLHLARTVKQNAKTCSQVEEGICTYGEAVRFNLADALKNQYEWMIDDVQVRPDSKWRGDFAEHRQSVIQQFARFACEMVDWEDFAKTILDKLAEVDKG
jgi:hypothetical protein